MGIRSDLCSPDLSFEEKEKRPICEQDAKQGSS